MSLAVAQITRTKFTTSNVVIATVTFDNSYVTGGLPFDPVALFGIQAIEKISGDFAGGYNFEYDYTNKKLKAFSGAAEAAAAANLSAVKTRVMVIGK